MGFAGRYGGEEFRLCRALPRQAPRPQRRGRARLCAADGEWRHGGTGELARQLAIQFEFARDAVAAGSFGEIERAVASLDQIRHRLARPKLSNPDRDRNARKNFPGRTPGDLTLRDRAANALGNHPAAFKVRAGKHGDQFFPAVPGRQISFPNAFLPYRCHQSKYLIAHTVSKIVVDCLELIDVDQQDAWRFPIFHRHDLGGTKEFLEGSAVWQAGEQVGLGARLRLVERIPRPARVSSRRNWPPAWRREWWP